MSKRGVGIWIAIALLLAAGAWLLLDQPRAKDASAVLAPDRPSAERDAGKPEPNLPPTPSPATKDDAAPAADQPRATAVQPESTSSADEAPLPESQDPDGCAILLIDAKERRLSDGWITILHTPQAECAWESQPALQWRLGFISLDQMLDAEGSRVDADEGGMAHFGMPSGDHTCGIVRAEAPGLVRYEYLNLAYSRKWTLTLEAPEKVTIRVHTRRTMRREDVPLRLHRGALPAWTGSMPAGADLVEVVYPFRNTLLHRMDGGTMKFHRSTAMAEFDFPCVSQDHRSVDWLRPEVELFLPPTGSMTLEIQSDAGAFPDLVLVGAVKRGKKEAGQRTVHAYRVHGNEVQLPWVEVGVDLHVAFVAGIQEPDPTISYEHLDKLFAAGAVVAGPTREGEHVRATVSPP